MLQSTLGEELKGGVMLKWQRSRLKRFKHHSCPGRFTCNFHVLDETVWYGELTSKCTWIVAGHCYLGFRCFRRHYLIVIVLNIGKNDVRMNRPQF